MGPFNRKHQIFAAKDGRLGFRFSHKHVVRELRVYRKHSNAACGLCFCC